MILVEPCYDLVIVQIKIVKFMIKVTKDYSGNLLFSPMGNETMEKSDWSIKTYVMSW